MANKTQIVPFAVLGGASVYLANRAVTVYQTLPANAPNKWTDLAQKFPETLAQHPLGFSLASTPVLASVGCLAAAFIFYQLRDTHEYRFQREYGSARWGTKREIKAFANKDFSQNIILGKNFYMNLHEGKKVELNRNNNVMVIGGSGSWKTTSFIMSNLAQMNTSFVLTDPKGITIRRVGKMLEEQGNYRVKVCDFDSLQNTDHFNPFYYIHDEISLKKIISVLIDATNGEHAKNNEPFWDKSEEMLLSAIFSYLYYKYRGDESTKGDGILPSLADIPDLIRLLERTGDAPSILEIYFDDFAQKFGRKNYAVLQFDSFKNYQGLTRASVVSIAAARFAMFDLPGLQDFIKDDTLEIDQWLERKYAVFLKIPDMDTTFNFLTVMVFLLAFRTLEDKVDNEYFGNPPVPIQFFFDEFANLGKIPNIKEALSVFRSRMMSLVILLQSLNQLKALYKDDWQSFLANCDSVVYLSGSTETETQKFFSEAGGKETIYTRERDRGRVIRRPMGRDLITFSEVGTMKRSKALVRIASMPLFKVNKYNYKKHPNAKYFSDNPRDGKWYFYRRYKNNKEKWQDNVVKAKKEGRRINDKTVDFNELPQLERKYI